jgi:hypothetical protein
LSRKGSFVGCVGRLKFRDTQNQLLRPGWEAVNSGYPTSAFAKIANMKPATNT